MEWDRDGGQLIMTAPSDIVFDGEIVPETAEKAFSVMKAKIRTN